MAALIRIVNAFYAALFLAAALISVGLLAAAPGEIGRGPSVLRASGWAALAAFLAILCLANMRLAGGAYRLRLLVANLAALLLAAAALAAGNPVLQWIGGVSILPFAIAVPALIAGRVRP